MTDPTPRQNTRALAKDRYRDKKNVESKWLDQYGSMSFSGDYSQNQKCLQEVFNMLDIVMENTINEYIDTHTPVKIRKEEHRTWYLFEKDSDNTFAFWYPQTFAQRTYVLRLMGYPLSRNLDRVRKIRNETAHGNQTVVLQNRSLDYEETKTAMTDMADALILLGALPAGLREPPFDSMRVHEGDTLQRGAYTVGALAGEGGMSRVYEGIQKHMGRKVAIKELKPDTFSFDQILHERDVLLRLHNDHIPHVYDMFFENGTYYMIMSYVEGITLEEYVTRKYPLPMDFVMSVSSALLDILSYLHSPNVRVVFTDLSPDNIMIDKEGVPWLIDFGISGEIQRKQALPAATAGYSAPEVFAEGILDERTDVYSFGYILRYLMTGCAPSEKTDVETASLTGEADFSELINYCIARNPEGRFQSIDALRKSFRQICDSRSREDLVRKEKRSRGKKYIIAVVLLCALAGAVGVFRVITRDEKKAGTAGGENAVTGTSTAEEDTVSSTEEEDTVPSSAEDDETDMVPGMPDIPETVQISSASAGEDEPSANEEELIRENTVVSDFSYDYEEKTLTVKNPANMWYTALVNWNDTERRNLLLGFSLASDVPEPAAFFCSPCILNGDISKIRLEYDDGTHAAFSFRVEDGVLVSYSLERFGEVYSTNYLYSGSQLSRFYTEKDRRLNMDCLLQYDEAGDLSTISCKDQMFLVDCDSRGYIITGTAANTVFYTDSIYRFSYTDNEIIRSVTDSQRQEEADRKYTLSEDGTLAACRYQIQTVTNLYEESCTVQMENTYLYSSS